MLETSIWDGIGLDLDVEFLIFFGLPLFFGDVCIHCCSSELGFVLAQSIMNCQEDL